MRVTEYFNSGLQNRVPKVRVLVPLPKKSLENPVFMRVSRLFCFSNLFSLCHYFSLFSTIFRINCNTNCNTDSWLFSKITICTQNQRFFIKKLNFVNIVQMRNVFFVYYATHKKESNLSIPTGLILINNTIYYIIAIKIHWYYQSSLNAPSAQSIAPSLVLS